MKRLLLPSLFALGLAAGIAADAAEPIKALLIAGGCCHDYSKQKDLLKEGIEKRANVTVEIAYSPDKSTKPNFPTVYGNPDYAKGYDVVIHDECAADVNDQSVVEGVLKPHRDGIPGVNLHCAMHCYRIGNPNEPGTAGTPHALWFEYLGLQSSGHGSQLPISISFTDHESPITKALSDWTTGGEELYNNVKIYTAQALAHGKQTVKSKKKQADGTETEETKDVDTVVAWTNLYQGKTRVFSTTIGHNDSTVQDDRYLDLVTNGLLWAVDKLDANGKPKAGYGK